MAKFLMLKFMEEVGCIKTNYTEVWLVSFIVLELINILNNTLLIVLLILLLNPLVPGVH